MIWAAYNRSGPASRGDHISSYLAKQPHFLAQRRGFSRCGRVPANRYTMRRGPCIATMYVHQSRLGTGQSPGVQCTNSELMQERNQTNCRGREQCAIRAIPGLSVRVRVNSRIVVVQVSGSLDDGMGIDLPFWREGGATEFSSVKTIDL